MSERKKDLAQYLACAWAAYTNGWGIEYAARHEVEADEFFESLAALLVDCHDNAEAAAATALAKARADFLRKAKRK
jgi:hypothetical protein